VGVPVHYRKRAAGVRAHVGNARRLELPESFFDVVFASNFLEHFGEEDLKHLMGGIERIFRPGGDGFCPSSRTSDTPSESTSTTTRTGGS
jgi:ubiquinone/menaquinone biosynthesis C-methylase UbiE